MRSIFNWGAALLQPPTPPPVSKEYWENSQWAYEHMNEISAKYPNQWVVIFDKNVIAASRSGSEAEHIAKEKVGNQEFVILFSEKGIRVYPPNTYLT